MGLTQALAAKIAATQDHDFDTAVLDLARTGIMDTLATAYAGSEEPVSRLALTYAGRRQITHAPQCTLPWTDQTLSVSQAALVFGTTGHALDYDDVALAGHPSTVLAPVVLCEGLSRHLSGKKCLQAYVVGYQVWAEMFRRQAEPLHPKGWHPTAVYGVIAGAAALAYLRGLSAAQTTTVLGTAASFSSGLAANFGTMTKPLHAGRAASMAFDALEFVSLGLSAAPDVLEHRAGFMHAVSAHGKIDRDTPPADEWLLSRYGLCIKKYPVCYSGHRVIDAVISLAKTHGLNLQNVQHARVGIGAAQLSMLRNTKPQTALEAKFSIQFAIASALDAQAVGLAQLNDAYVQSPALQAFYSKVEPYIVAEEDKADPTFSAYDEIAFTLADGATVGSGRVPLPTGHADLPLSKEALITKFEDCVSGHPSLKMSPTELGYRLLALADSPDINQIFNT